MFCEVDDSVRKELDVSGVTNLIGADAIFDSLEDVIGAYKRQKSVIHL